MIYNACDVLLIPSSSEGFGFPVIEAFATGLPVVASDIEIFREITRDSAILSKIDPEELSHSVVNAIDQRETYSNKGLETAKYYSFDNFKNNVRSYYSKNFGINFNES
jgi:glycosyltransferase involved in cell wall biosynthesis